MAETRAATFLKGLQIKGATFGGFDKTDTFTKFKELAYIYEDILAQEREENKREKEELEILRADIRSKENEVDRLTEDLNKLELEKAELKKTISERERNHSTMEASILRNSEEIIRKARSESDTILNDARREKEVILSSAKAEREGILKKAHDEALRNRAEVQKEVITLKNEKKTILMELKVIRDQLAGALHTADDTDVLAE